MTTYGAFEFSLAQCVEEREEERRRICFSRMPIAVMMISCFRNRIIRGLSPHPFRSRQLTWTADLNDRWFKLWKSPKTPVQIALPDERVGGAWFRCQTFNVQLTTEHPNQNLHLFVSAENQEIVVRSVDSRQKSAVRFHTTLSSVSGQGKCPGFNTGNGRSAML